MDADEHGSPMTEAESREFRSTVERVTRQTFAAKQKSRQEALEQVRRERRLGHQA